MQVVIGYMHDVTKMYTRIIILNYVFASGTLISYGNSMCESIAI